MSQAVDLFVPGKSGGISVRTKGLETQPAKVIVMVQGSNMTGQTMFDFNYPGPENYSVMDALVAQGWGTVTFAVRGYGKSELSGDPFAVGTDAAMEDLGSVIDWVIAQGHIKPHILAFSWGGRIAGRWAQTNGDKIDRLILYDAARGGGNLVLPGPGPDEGWWTNTYEAYAEKLEPHLTDPAFLRALGNHVVANEPRSPNGIRLENATPYTAIDPTKVTVPTMMIYGIEGAKALYMQGGMSRGDFFEALATDDKSFVLLPGGGDFIHWQKGRARFYKAVKDFLVTQ